jgi:TP901 family phage tail tape measure protein
VNAGAIVYQILMQGAAVFKKDSADAEQAIKKLGAEADASAKKVSAEGTELDTTGQKARKAKAPLEDAAKASKKVGDESNEAAPKVKSLGQEFTQMDAKTQQAARTVGTAMLSVGTAIALVGGLAVAKFAEFEVATDKTAAAANASASENRDLAASALELGAASQYSASQAAAGQTELIKAGVSVKDVLGGGLAGSLSLAAAGELEVARAAEIAATTLSVFKLQGKDAGHVADLLAAGAGKAQGSVDDLSLALGYVGPTFARLNIPLEDTVGTLALLAANGILGEKAGTGLRSTIASLTSPVAKGSEVMKQYGIDVFDAQGNFIGLQGAAEELKQGLGGLDEEQRSAALGAIFGAEAANTAGTLYEAGAEGVAAWTDKVNESGYAQRQAFEMTDNLTGDIERLGGSFDSALIGTGAAANDVLRDMVQIVTSLVDWYGNLPEPVQATTLYLGLGAAAVLLLGGALLLAIPKIAEFRLALSTLNTEMPKTASAAKGVTGFLFGPWGLALTAAIAILGAFGSAQAENAAKVEQFSSTLDTQSNKVTDSTREMIKANLAAKQSFWFIESDSAYDAAKKLGIGLDIVTDAAMGNVGSMKQLNSELELGEVGSAKLKQQMDDSGLSASDLAVAYATVKDAVAGESSSLEEAIRVAEQKNSVDSDTVDSTGTTADAYQAAADSAGSLLDNLTQLLDTINEANGINQDAVSANVDYQQSIADIDGAIQKAREGQEGYSLTLDQTTQAGRDNNNLLLDLAKSGREAADATFAADGNTQNYKSALDASRQAVYQRALDLTGNADAAAAIADNIARIPTESEWKVIAETADATRQINEWVSIQNGKQVHIAVGLGGAGGLTQADGGVVDYYANGGVRENHVAQIAAAGSYRVWAESETGGEGYVPLALSKRARSEEIMAVIANRFGGQYIPGGQAFADGGFSGTYVVPQTGGGRTTNVTIHVYPSAGMNEKEFADKVADAFRGAVR